jgi:hypothetical protein
MKDRDYLEYDTIRYLFTAVGFPPSGSGPYTFTQYKNNNIHKEKNTDHRIHKIESETYKTKQ